MKQSDTYLSVESPCGEDWQNMTGDGQTRHCQQCDKQVHHLSAMPLKQVKRLLASSEAVCVRYETDAAGQVITLADKPPFWFFYRDLPKKVAVILVLVLCLTAGQANTQANTHANAAIKAVEPTPLVQGGLNVGPPTTMGDVVTAPKKVVHTKPTMGKPSTVKSGQQTLPAKTRPNPVIMGEIAAPHLHENPDKPKEIAPKTGIHGMVPNATMTGRALVRPGQQNLKLTSPKACHQKPVTKKTITTEPITKKPNINLNSNPANKP